MQERFLLDKSIVLVSLEAPERLSAKARRLLQRGDLHVSVLAYWEVMLKTMKGRLEVGSVGQWWKASLTLLGAIPLPLYPDHIAAIAGLPPVHKDPFDRALVAQASFEGLTLLTADEILLQYASDRIRVLHAPILSE